MGKRPQKRRVCIRKRPTKETYKNEECLLERNPKRDVYVLERDPQKRPIKMRSVYWKETPNETCMYWKETHKVRTSIFWWWSMNCDVKREACLSCQTWGKKKRRVCIEKEADKRDLTFQECGSLVLVSFWCCFDVRRVYHVRREACLLKRDPNTSPFVPSPTSKREVCLSKRDPKKYLIFHS